MSPSDRILILDDDEYVLRTTHTLLSRAGYQCDCAPDVQSVNDKLSKGEYDLLLSDIKMPGNENLEFVRDLSSGGRRIPVILMTAYPEIDSAIESIKLGVVDYVKKPYQPDEFLEVVRVALHNSRVYRVLAAERERLQSWRKDLAAMEESLFSGGPASPMSVGAYMELTYRNIGMSLSGLRSLTEAVAGDNINSVACGMLNCPKLQKLRNALGDAIEVLRQTKAHYKSKDLADLRKELEVLMKETER